jgi:arylsulfatase A-like enzyme
MISAMDDQIGKIVNELDKKGLRNNTIIIFHSDNGGNQNAHLGEAKVEGSLPASNGLYRGGKGDLYEGGTLVPSIINWPGKIKEGTVVKGIMHVVDYFPTLANLAGASTAKSKGLDGKDQWQSIINAQPSPRDEVVYNVELFRGAVRKGDWKLVWKTVLPANVELFNLAQDPYEKTNVAAQNPAKVTELEDRINQLAKEMAKSMLLQDIFKGVMASALGKPPVLPNEDEFYEQGD